MSADTRARGRRTSIARLKYLDVGSPIPIASLSTPTKPKELTPRQRAIVERDEEIRRVVKEATMASESEAIPIKPKGGQKIAALRAAIGKVIEEMEAPVNVGVRRDTIYLSRVALPGRQGRRRKAT